MSKTCHKVWSEEEESKLKQLVLSGNYKTRQIAEILGRTEISITGKLQKLNLRLKETVNGVSKYHVNWTPEEDELLKSTVSMNLSFKDIQLKYFQNKTPKAISHRYQFLELKSNYVAHKYSHNENFFETPNPINCYFAGLLASDGSINKDKSYITIRLNIDDLHILEEFKKNIDYTGNIKIYNLKNTIINGISYKRKKMSVLTINSASKLIKDLECNFNIVQNKTHIVAPPNLTDPLLIKCFILGYIDGDGAVCKCNSKEKMRIHITSCSEKILIWIKEQMDAMNLGSRNDIKSANVNKTKNSNVYRYCICSNKAIRLFKELSELDVPKLNRKWKDSYFLDIINQFFNISPASV